MPQPTGLSAPRSPGSYNAGTHGNLPAIANQACTEATRTWRWQAGGGHVAVIAVVKNMFRFEPFIRSWKGVSLFEVRSLNIS
jgi:hypothetical protein